MIQQQSNKPELKIIQLKNKVGLFARFFRSQINSSISFTSFLCKSLCQNSRHGHKGEECMGCIISQTLTAVSESQKTHQRVWNSRLVGGRNLSLNLNLVSLTLAAHQHAALSFHPYKRKKIKTNKLMKCWVKNQLNMSKCHKKYCSQRRKNQKFTRNGIWLAIIINNQRKGKKIFSHFTIQSDPFLVTTLE